MKEKPYTGYLQIIPKGGKRGTIYKGMKGGGGKYLLYGLSAPLHIVSLGGDEGRPDPPPPPPNAHLAKGGNRREMCVVWWVCTVVGV